MKQFTVFFGTLFLLFININIYAQENVDKVYMLNGDVNEGTVKAIEASSITFIYKGETLEYTFEKAKISKIVFASGRTQVINEAAPAAATTTAPMGDSRNKLAVIPYVMISNEGSLTTREMSEDIQHTTVNSFKENTRGILIMDPMTTNALLLRNNLNAETIKTKLPQEVAKLLGVEFVVYGTANINFEGTSTFGSTSTTYKDKEKKEDKEKKSSGKEFSSTSTSTLTKYDTTIEMNIFNDQGQNLYNVKRNGFGSSLDQYQSTINYLVKRCPWGTKNK
ncbi:hypothetical protein [Robertkochia solimangrovi]|uniref:hypothetical protein n=1 Tax=Robertkochia solimangrovi TaxID=2213046 RepID=UPI00118173B3|nr:hypothetical protein [Robertkochia solimangrovi]TRZ46105.1 hypothetical protein DMZ48_02235 [Robertkochia solimangrovi]